MEPTLSKYDRIVKLINNNCKPEEAVELEEYLEELLDDSLKLNALIAAGVDNWEWYGEAMNIYNEWEKEEK